MIELTSDLCEIVAGGGDKSPTTKPPTPRPPPTPTTGTISRPTNGESEAGKIFNDVAMAIATIMNGFQDKKTPDCIK